MSLIDGSGVCKGVNPPYFIPFTTDVPNLITWKSVPNDATKANGTVLFYSNKDWLVNFYLQGISDATETIIKSYMNYSDGYAVTVAVNFPASEAAIGQDIGFCLTSQIAGQSCFSISPDATNGNFYLKDVKSYWQAGKDIQNPASNTYLMSGMAQIQNADPTACYIEGFNKSWRCTKGLWKADEDASPLVSQNGFFHFECSRFLPTEQQAKATDLTDYRFAPFSYMNNLFTPISLWYYKTANNAASPPVK